jgi:hypothetical protein
MIPAPASLYLITIVMLYKGYELCVTTGFRGCVTEVFAFLAMAQL